MFTSKLESAPQSETLYIIRNQTKLFRAMFPALANMFENKNIHLKIEVKQLLDTLHQISEPFISRATDDYVDSINTRIQKIKDVVLTIKSQLNLIPLQISNNKNIELIKKMLSSEDNCAIIAKLFVYGYYLLKKILGEGYEQLFKDNLKILNDLANQAQPLLDFTNFIQACTDKDTLKALPNLVLFEILPLACHGLYGLDQKLDGFISAEMMGHGVAYLIAENPGQYQTLVVKNDAEKILESYTIQEINVETNAKIQGTQKNMRLMGTILIPNLFNEIESKQVTPPIIPIYIVWAGTYSAETFLADLEISAGEESYRKGEQQIMRQIAKAVQILLEKTSKPFIFNISGHSLGGALSMLTTHSLERWLAFNSQNPSLLQKIELAEKNFKEHSEISKNYSLPDNFFKNLTTKKPPAIGITLQTFNATRVLDCVADYSNLLCTWLVQQNIPHTVYLGSIKNDSVENTGQRVIWDDITKNGVTFYLLQVDSNAPTILSLFETLAISLAERKLPTKIKNELFLGGLLSFFEGVMDKIEAHKQMVFLNGQVDPISAYVMYCNKDSKGQLNLKDIIKIHEILSYSSYIVERATAFIAELLDSLTEDQLCQLIANDNPKIVAKIIQNQNVSNQSNQKSIFQRSLEKGYFKLALKLVDPTRSSSMLATVMQYLNTYWRQPPIEAYTLAKTLLNTAQTLSNNDKLAIENINNQWKNSWLSIFNSKNTTDLVATVENKLNTKVQITIKEKIGNH